MLGFRRNEERARRRTRKEMQLEGLDDTIAQKHDEIDALNNEIIKLHKRKSDLSDEVLNSVQEYQEAGYHVPSVRKYEGKATTFTELLLESADDPSLKIPRSWKSFGQKFLSARPELTMKIDALLDSFITTQVDKRIEAFEKKLNPASEMIDR